VFLGTGDLSGVADDQLSIAFMVIVTLFGTLILTNLLIALMTTSYEEVQDAADKQVIHTRTELTREVKSGTRLMPAPLNVIVFIISVVIDILNFFLALIYPRWNIYRLISAELFMNLQNTNIFHIWESSKHWKPLHGSESLFNTRMDVIRWYFESPFWRFGNLRKYVCGFVPDAVEDALDNAVGNDDGAKVEKSWKHFHKACYGVLVLENQATTVPLRQRVRGITMSRYLDRFERKRGQKIDHADKQLLKQLSTNTLFCKFCCRPFLKENAKKELTTAYTAYMDLISAFLFLFVLWIPMTICFFVVASVTWFLKLFEGTDAGDKEEDYKATDYDKEYLPNQH